MRFIYLQNTIGVKTLIEFIILLIIYFIVLLLIGIYAHKKTEKNVYEIDLSKLSFTKEKYIDQIKQFIEEHMSESKVSKSGNSLNVSVPESISKRMLKMRISKFLYSSGLKSEYRLISMENAGKAGYQIMER